MLTFSPKAITKEFLAQLPERSKNVLFHRFGLGSGERRTLEAIGQNYGITRERIRQIESHGLGLIRESDAYGKHSESLARLKEVLLEIGHIAAEHDILATIPKNDADRNHVLFLLTVGHHFTFKKEDAHFYPRWYVDQGIADAVTRALLSLHESIDPGELTPEEQFFEQFATALKNEGIKEKDPVIIRRWLSISKKVGRNPLGEWGHADSPHVHIKNTRDFAFLTLKRHGSPMHFTEVAETIEKLFKREAHPATTHNELIKDERFVLVGRGLYALKEWGYQPGVVRDVIANVLKKDGPLSKQEIIERVKRERYVKDATVLVNLQSPLFVRQSDGRYALA
jgi:hypothetical protein